MHSENVRNLQSTEHTVLRVIRCKPWNAQRWCSSFRTASLAFSGGECGSWDMNTWHDLVTVCEPDTQS